MNEEEQALANYVYASIQEFANSSERSQQQRDFKIGVSNLGFCSEFLKRLIKEEAPDPRAGDYSAAFIGTAIGDYVERAVKARWPGSQSQVSITVHLQGALREYEILGHPDFVTPNSVLDFKGLALDTPIPTPSGWTTMGALEVGDLVFDRDGQAVRVTAASAVKQIDCWTIEFRNGLSVVCDDEHRWVIALDRGREETVTVNEIAARKAAGRPVSVVLGAGLVTPPIALPIDPWLYGYWLGNGRASGATLSTHGEDLEHVVAAVASAGWGTTPRMDPRANAGRVSVHAPVRGQTSLTKLLAELGSLGYKAVAPIYLRAGTAQRRAMLQGLMDSDGSWNRKRRRVSFTSTNIGLSDAVAELARSLGERVQRHSVWRTGYGKTVRAHDVEWTPSFVPFALPRKANQVSLGKAKTHRHSVVSVHRTLTVPTKCISVDSPSRTYLCTEAMIPTHNTVNGYERLKRKGPSRQQLFQRHLYALGCHQAGMFSVPLEEVRTGNVWIDRSATERGCYVHLDRYSPEIVAEAIDWLDEVTYGVLNDAEVPKEPSREFCRDWCGFYSTCRAQDTDATGLIQDDDLLSAIEVWHEGSQMEKQAKRLKAEAASALLGVSGSTGTHTVRWVHVNGGPVSYMRNEYERLSINPLPPPRRKP